ncbi:MAG: hypothetical protein AB1793_05085 [Candidatus Thermoplasmatota archaeon]
MKAFDHRSASVLAAGLLASMVLLSASSVPPSLTVSELWGLGGNARVTVEGILVSLWTYDSGAEAIVLADHSGPLTARVMCSPGPGPPPSAAAAVGDLVSASGECVFEDGAPTVFCRYGDVRLLKESQDILTVGLLAESWELFEGDRFTVRGVCGVDRAGAPRLSDPDGAHGFALILDDGVAAAEGEVIVDCTLAVDRSTMAIVLEAHSITPAR